VNDVLNQLRHLPPPAVSPELTARVLNRVYAIVRTNTTAASVQVRSPASRSDKAFGFLVAAVSLAHAVWTVVFTNRLAH
jgi:hypothetical protein